MAVRRTPDGTWEFDSVAEALSFERGLRPEWAGAATAPERIVVVDGSGAPADRHAQSDLLVRHGDGEQITAVETKTRQRLDRSNQEERAIRTLRLLADAAPGGLLVEDMQGRIGLEVAKGFSGVSQAIRNRITAHARGQDVERFFWKERRPGKPGRWHVDPEKLKEIGLL